MQVYKMCILTAVGDGICHVLKLDLALEIFSCFAVLSSIVDWRITVALVIDQVYSVFIVTVM